MVLNAIPGLGRLQNLFVGCDWFICVAHSGFLSSTGGEKPRPCLRMKAMIFIIQKIALSS